MKHRAPTMFAAMAVLLVLGAASPAHAQVTDRTVLVGTGESGYAVNLFGPAEFTVAVGSTVTFHNPWFEPHTVTFTEGGAPPPPPSDPTAAIPSHPGETLLSITGDEYVSSGFFFRDQSFQAQFPEAGQFDFFCIIHPGMQGTVTVVEDAAEATPQAQMDAQADAVFSATLDLLKAEAATLAARPVTAQANPDGTTTWRPVIVGGLVGTSDVMQFFPPSIDVQVGDTVLFESDIPVPHTVTFMAGPPPFPPDMQDPFEEPTFVMPFGPAGAFAGDQFLNSGVIGVGWPAGLTFEVTFTAAGSFPYICLLHADQDMVGVVNVSAGPPAPPASGQAGLVNEASTGWLVQLAMLAGVLALVAATAVATRRGRSP